MQAQIIRKEKVLKNFQKKKVQRENITDFITALCYNKVTKVKRRPIFGKEGTDGEPSMV